jgi:hypothetical protein
MIDASKERVVTFGQASDILPRRRRGRKIALSTFYRWSDSGCRGVRLETIEGGARCTSLEALQRFLSGSPGRTDSGLIPIHPPQRPDVRRQLDSEEAGRELERHGA